jgi:uncharacterized protein YuzB (UPF0349 family)
MVPPMKVRLCEKNKGKNKAMNRLTEKLPDLDVKIKKCIDMCGDCDKHRIARVDGKKVVAKDSEELVEKIVSAEKKDRKT